MEDNHIEELKKLSKHDLILKIIELSKKNEQLEEKNLQFNQKFGWGRNSGIYNKQKFEAFVEAMYPHMVDFYRELNKRGDYASCSKLARAFQDAGLRTQEGKAFTSAVVHRIQKRLKEWGEWPPKPEDGIL